MKLTGSKAVLEAFRREKVDLAFGYPGGVIMPLYDAMLDENDFRHILTRHEQGAAHAAEGYARASGKTGVCISTSGPGGTNLLTGIADAYMDSVPLVAISGQVVRALIGGDAFQEADMFGLTMPITKHNFKVMDEKELPRILKTAFTVAQLGRPGPVHIDLPKDVQTAELEFDYPKNITLPGYNPTTKGHPMQIKKAVDMLLNAERPLILAGGGVITANAGKEITRLAEVLMCPVSTTMMAKGAISEYHPLSIMVPGMHGKQAANYAMQNCDVLFAIGCRFDDRITGQLKTFAPLAKVIHADIDTAEIGKNVGVDLPIVGDAKIILDDMLAFIDKEKRKGKENEWRKRIAELREACNCDIGYDEKPIRPQRIIHELNRLLPEDAIVVTEVGQNQMWAMHFFKSRHARHYISSGGLGTMGFGLPASIGAKASQPGKKVVDVAGDGSLLMVCQEFVTSVENNLPVIACLINNGWLGMVKQWQKLFYDKRYSATHLGQLPNFVKLVESMGGKGEAITEPSAIAEGIRHALKSDVAYVIDIHTDPEEDVLPMVPPGGNNSSMIPGRGCPNVVKKIAEFGQYRK